MKAMILFILFLCYTVGIFFVNEPIILLWCLGIQIILMLGMQIKVRKVIHTMVWMSGFVLFTGAMNWLLADLASAILITVKLFLVCHITYLFSFVMTPVKLANTIVVLLSPLKLFKVDTEQIGLMISIAITFIPILKKEFMEFRLSLKAKGKTMSFQNATIVLKPFFIKVMQRINEMELSLRAKAFEES